MNATAYSKAELIAATIEANKALEEWVEAGRPHGLQHATYAAMVGTARHCNRIKSALNGTLTPAAYSNS